MKHDWYLSAFMEIRKTVEPKYSAQNHPTAHCLTVTENFKKKLNLNFDFLVKLIDATLRKHKKRKIKVNNYNKSKPIVKAKTSYTQCQLHICLKTSPEKIILYILV